MLKEDTRKEFYYICSTFKTDRKYLHIGEFCLADFSSVELCSITT